MHFTADFTNVQNNTALKFNIGYKLKENIQTERVRKRGRGRFLTAGMNPAQLPLSLPPSRVNPALLRSAIIFT